MNIQSGGGEGYRLEESEEIVEIIGEMLIWPSFKLGSPNHSSLKEASLSVHRCGWIHGKQEKVREYGSKRSITHPMVKPKSYRASVTHFSFDAGGKSRGGLEHSSPKSPLQKGETCPERVWCQS